MDETFDRQALIGPDTLAALRRRSNAPSLIRLILHLAALGAVAALAAAAHGTIWVVPAVIVLAALMAAMFAPFHECTHNTAFASPALNRLGLFAGALFFGVSPTLYRDFHFDHHRYTNDPEHDPELRSEPGARGWATDRWAWLEQITYAGRLRERLAAFWRHWFRPVAATAGIGDRDKAAAINLETRIIGAFWGALLIAGLFGVPGALEMVAAFCLASVFEGIWLRTEHTGRAFSGTIFERTRTVETHPLVRFFLWNMNYHAEHHAWPAIPWHALPAAHARIRDRIDPAPGYLAVHRKVYAALD